MQNFENLPPWLLSSAASLACGTAHPCPTLCGTRIFDRPETLGQRRPPLGTTDIRTHPEPLRKSGSEEPPNGLQSPKYSPGSGKESSNSYEPIDGVPAALAVNLGKTLSYVWDTTECRLLYAWTDGFLDMKNYWGDQQSGRRRGFGYVPRLYGFVFYKAVGEHPLSIDGKSLSAQGAPQYQGYSLDSDLIPVYDYQIGSKEISVKIQPGPATQILKIEFSSGDMESLAFKSPNTPIEVIQQKPGKLTLHLRPNAGERFPPRKKGS